MAITQAVQDGKLVDTTASATSQSQKKTESGSNLDKDAFLQLLVAQMKYQDPLEPTDNTQYVSQLATFSQLEETQNMQSAIVASNANDLVGKDVILKVTSSVTGETSYVSGTVDYVTFEGGDAYLSVNDKLYSIDDLDTVADSDYTLAVNMARAFKDSIAALPTTAQLTLNDASKLTDLRKAYDGMTTYQQSYVSEDDVKKLEELEKRMEVLKAAANTTGDKTDTDNTTDTDDKTDTDNTTDTTTE